MTTVESVNIVIALIALIIAFFEFVDFWSKRREAKRKERSIAELKSIIVSVEEALKPITTEIEYSTTKRLFAYYTLLSGMELYKNRSWEVHQKIYEQLMQIGNVLLKCESEFALSYGFGRYIDCLRPILYSDIYTDYCYFLNELEKNYSPEKFDYHVNVVRGWTEVTDSSQPYYEHYCRVRECHQALIDEYIRIKPFLREMSIRFDADRKAKSNELNSEGEKEQ